MTPEQKLALKEILQTDGVGGWSPQPGDLVWFIRLTHIFERQVSCGMLVENTNHGWHLMAPKDNDTDLPIEVYTRYIWNTQEAAEGKAKLP